MQRRGIMQSRARQRGRNGLRAPVQAMLNCPTCQLLGHPDVVSRCWLRSRPSAPPVEPALMLPRSGGMAVVPTAAAQATMSNHTKGAVIPKLRFQLAVAISAVVLFWQQTAVAIPYDGNIVNCVTVREPVCLYSPCSCELINSRAAESNESGAAGWVQCAPAPINATALRCKSACSSSPS
jgi:hypothetical protein